MSSCRKNSEPFSSRAPTTVMSKAALLARHCVAMYARWRKRRVANIRVTCNLFADHVERQHEIEQFWLDVVGLPATSLCKSTVNTYSKYSKKKRQNKLPCGTCRLTVNRTRIVQSIYGSIQEYAGFDRPAWLE